MIYLPTLPSPAKLPYAMDALHPYISGESICFIEQKILPSHLDTLDTLLKQYAKQHDGNIKSIPLTEYLSMFTDARLSTLDSEQHLIHRYASEIYNHAFYFASMHKKGGGQPPSDFYAKLLRDFGSFEKFENEFIKAVTCAKSLDRHWVWLVATADDKLAITGDDLAHPLAQNLKPLAVINLWQHAYYLDYRERKGDYAQAFLTKLIAWQHVESAFYDPKAWDWT